MTRWLNDPGLTRRGFVLGAVGAGLALAGCGGDDETTPPAGAGTTTGDVGTTIDLSGSGEVVVVDAGGPFGEAQRIAHWEPFEAATGIKVVPQPGSGLVEIASIKAGRPKWDVAETSPESLALFDGLLLPIDYSLWEKANLDAFTSIPTTEFTVPWIIGSSNIVYDATQFADNPPSSWADVWDVDRYPGRRSFYPASYLSGAPEIPLLADGVAPADLYPIDFDRLFKSLDRIRPSILRFGASGGDVARLIIDGRVAAGSEFNGRITDLQEKGASALGTTWDQAMAWSGILFVPKGAKNVENAMKFIAFISQPEQQARFSETIPFAPPNSLAYDLISPARRSVLPTAPENVDKLVFVDADFWNGVDAKSGKPRSELLTDLWEEWLTG